MLVVLTFVLASIQEYPGRGFTLTKRTRRSCGRLDNEDLMYVLGSVFSGLSFIGVGECHGRMAIANCKSIWVLLNTR